MQLSREEIEKVALLARLEFTPDELGAFSEQLGSIVEFVDQLAQVNTDGVEEMAHPLDVHSVLRPDVLSAGLSREEALATSPSNDGECFQVPAVMAR